MTAPATPAPAPKPRVTAHDRALRQMRIFARMQEGWSYDAIAQDERLSRERVRQIVAETPALREIDAVRDHTRSQIARLDPALRLAAGKVAEGDLRAIDRLLKGLARLDKYQGASAARAKAEGPKISAAVLTLTRDRHDRACPGHDELDANGRSKMRTAENLREGLTERFDRLSEAYDRTEDAKAPRRPGDRAVRPPGKSEFQIFLPVRR
jgi:hypothetical protein